MKKRVPKKPAKNLGGRPPKITPAIVEEVAQLMAKGVPERYACALVGVNSETYGPAVSRNPAFKRIAERHHATFIAESVEIIRKGGEVIQVQDGQDNEGNPIFKDKVLPWTGRAWLLERRHKPDFNRTETLAPTNAKGESRSLEADLEALEKVVKRTVLGREMKNDGQG